MPDPKPYSYDLIKEGEETMLRIDCSDLSYIPSLEDSAIVMAKTIDIMMEVGAITKIVVEVKKLGMLKTVGRK